MGMVKIMEEIEKDMNIIEGKLDVIEKESATKPALSNAAISTGMLGLGVVMALRGALYFVSFCKAEKAWVKRYQL